MGTAMKTIFPRRSHAGIPVEMQDPVFSLLWQAGVSDQEPEFPVGQAVAASVIVKTEVPGMDHCIGLGAHGKIVNRAELAMGIADQQESRANVFHALSCVPVP